MNRLGQFLRALFWVPIVLAGFTAFAFVSPNFGNYRLPCVALLALFVVLGIVQTLFEYAENRTTRDRPDWRQSR